MAGMIERQGGAFASLGADSSIEWQGRLSVDRPTYECPTCRAPAMQFFRRLPNEPEREDFFRCFACGLTFEI